MMKKQNFLVLALMALAATGCDTESDGVQNESGKVPLQLRGNITASVTVATRATETAWEADDAIGVYMLSKEGAIAEGVDNSKYTTAGDGAFNAVQPSYLPEDGSNVDVAAYYPYSEAAAGGNVSIDMANAPVDLMTASATDLSKASPAANLTFSHRFSKLLLRLDAGDTGIDVSAISATVLNQSVRATYNVLTGSLSIAGDTPKGDIAMTRGDGTLEAILLPNDAVNVAADRTVQFYLGDGQSFTATIPAATEFAGGNKYVYKVLLQNASAARPSVELSNVSISPWTETEVGNIEVPVSRQAKATVNIGNTPQNMTIDGTKKVYSWTGEIAAGAEFNFSHVSAAGETVRYSPAGDAAPALLNDYEAPQTAEVTPAGTASDKKWTVKTTGVYTVSLNTETKEVSLFLNVVAQAYNDQTWGEQQTVRLERTAAPGVYQADLELTGNKQFRLLAGTAKTDANWDNGYQYTENAWPGFGTNNSDTFTLKYADSSLGNFWTDNYPGSYTLTLNSTAEGLSLTVAKKMTE